MRGLDKDYLEHHTQQFKKAQTIFLTNSPSKLIQTILVKGHSQAFKKLILIFRSFNYYYY